MQPRSNQYTCHTKYTVHPYTYSAIDKVDIDRQLSSDSWLHDMALKWDVVIQFLCLLNKISLKLMTIFQYCASTRNFFCKILLSTCECSVLENSPQFWDNFFKKALNFLVTTFYFFLHFIRPKLCACDFCKKTRSTCLLYSQFIL